VPDWDNTESRESDEDAAWRDLVARFETPTTTAGATTPGAGTPRTSAPATSLPGSSGSRTRGQTRTPKVPPNLGGATGAKGPGILSAKQLRELRELRERIQSGGTK